MFDDMKWRMRLNEARQMLETELRLIKAGAVTELAANDAKRQAVIERLVDMPEDAATRNEAALRQIRALADRNQRLLKAYLAGAADALTRITALDKSGREIGAYRQDGTRLPGVNAGPTHESRA